MTDWIFGFFTFRSDSLAGCVVVMGFVILRVTIWNTKIFFFFFYIKHSLCLFLRWTPWGNVFCECLEAVYKSEGGRSMSWFFQRPFLCILQRACVLLVRRIFSSLEGQMKRTLSFHSCEGKRCGAHVLWLLLDQVGEKGRKRRED